MIGTNQKIIFKKRFKTFRERENYFERVYIPKKKKSSHSA